MSCSKPHETSCCSKPKEEEQTSCCAKPKQEETSCCSKPKQEESSCCSKPKQEESSCCSMPKDYEGAPRSKKIIDKPVIDRHMTIEEILSSFPSKAQKLAQELTQAGLNCVGCQAATWETLEAGMLGHGMNENAIETLVKRLNDVLGQESDPNTITLTKRAAEKFIEILEEEGKQGYGLRLSLKMAGCSGFEYVLDYSEKATSEDEVFVSHGIEIHAEKKLLPKLLGIEIDFVDGLNGSGFKISNPNAKSACGCGTSHGY